MEDEFIDLDHYYSIRDIILDKKDIEEVRYVEIYKITCKETNKSYVGQSVSHVLNHGRYRPYGAKKRFDAHVSEAHSNKYGQCRYLNDDILEYGADKFEVEILLVCREKDGNYYEHKMMYEHDTIMPNGYNGSTVNTRCLDARTIEKYNHIKSLDKDNEDYLVKKSIQGVHVGWRVRIDRLETAFTSTKYTPEENREMALNFIQQLREKIEAKHLVAGSS